MGFWLIICLRLYHCSNNDCDGSDRGDPKVFNRELLVTASEMYVTLTQWSLMFTRHTYLVQWTRMFIRHTYPVKPDVHTSHLPSEADVHTSLLPSEAWCSYVTLTQWSLMFIRHTYPVKPDVHTSHLPRAVNSDVHTSHLPSEADVHTSHLPSEAWCSWLCPNNHVQIIHTQSSYIARKLSRCVKLSNYRQLCDCRKSETA